MTTTSPVYFKKNRQPRLGPQFKRPHFDRRPFRSTLFWAYRTNQPCIDNLRTLRASIQDRSFKAFFKQEEIDALLEQEVLNPDRSGNYQGPQSLQSLSLWMHFLNNFASMAYLSLSYKECPKDEIEHDKESIQTNLRQFKIIEDWFFYHQDILDAVIANVPSPEETAKLNTLLAILNRR